MSEASPTSRDDAAPDLTPDRPDTPDTSDAPPAPPPFRWTAGSRAVAAALTLAFGAAAVVGAGPSWHLVPLLLAAFVTAGLVVIDTMTSRLPNRIVLPAIVGVGSLSVGTALLDLDPLRAVGALLGGVALFAIYLAVALIGRGAMGMGDVKLAAVLGLVLGSFPWPTWPLGLIAGFLVGAIVSGIALATRRVSLRTHLPFGPAMIVGAWAAVVAAPWFAAAGALT